MNSLINHFFLKDLSEVIVESFRFIRVKRHINHHLNPYTITINIIDNNHNSHHHNVPNKNKSYCGNIKERLLKAFKQYDYIKKSED